MEFHLSFMNFSIIHLLTQVVGDVELIVEIGSPGTIISPGYYYYRYPSDVHTSWTLTSRDDIFLYTIDFNVETCCDIVYVSFVSELFPNIYQVDRTYFFHSKRSFVQDDKRIDVVFISNDEREDRGFVFKYLALSKSRKHAVNADEYIASAEKLSQVVLNRIGDPTRSFYKLMVKALSNHKLRISVVYTDMASSVHCTKDYIHIYDGADINHKTILLQKCSNVTIGAPTEVISLGNLVIVEYSCQLSLTNDDEYLSNICAILNYQAVPDDYDYSSIIDDMSVNFQFSPSSVGLTYETMFKLDTSHLRVSLTSVNVFGMKLQRYPDKHSKSDYIEILLDFHDGSMLTTNISMNIMGRPKEFFSDQKVWYLNSTYTFWIMVGAARLWFGQGSVVTVNALYYMDLGKWYDFNTISLKGNTGSAKILSECDNLYIGKNQTVLTNIFGEVHYTLLSNSYTYQLWLIQTSNEEELLRLDVTESRITATPDCLMERVSLYRGDCPRKSKRMTYFCGNTLESYTQTVGMHTTIEYMSSLIPISVLEDQDLLRERYFTISYEMISPSRTTSIQEQKLMSLHIVVIVAVVCIFIVIITIIAFFWRYKTNLRTRLTLPNLQNAPHLVQQAQLRPYHTRAPYINQPFRFASLPNTSIRHHTNTHTVETPNIFRRIPPSNFYSRHRLSMTSTHRHC